MSLPIAVRYRINKSKGKSQRAKSKAKKQGRRLASGLAALFESVRFQGEVALIEAAIQAGDQWC
jgi:hypothetical protein